MYLKIKCFFNKLDLLKYGPQCLKPSSAPDNHIEK